MASSFVRQFHNFATLYENRILSIPNFANILESLNELNDAFTTQVQNIPQIILTLAWNPSKNILATFEKIFEQKQRRQLLMYFEEYKFIITLALIFEKFSLENKVQKNPVLKWFMTYDFTKLKKTGISERIVTAFGPNPLMSENITERDFKIIIDDLSLFSKQLLICFYDNYLSKKILG